MELAMTPLLAARIPAGVFTIMAADVVIQLPTAMEIAEELT